MAFITGALSGDFSLLFFTKQFLLIPLNIPRKDFEFCPIVLELFVFLTDSRVYSPPWSRDSPLPGDINLWSTNDWCAKIPASAKYSREGRVNCNEYTVGSRLLAV